MQKDLLFKMLNRTKPNIKILIFTICLVLAIIPCGCSAPQTPISRTGFYFDTIIQITIYDSGKEKCLDECMKLADKYEKLLSSTIEGSDIWNINHSNGQPVVVSDETLILLEDALSYCDMTNGRIDLTIEAVSELWDFHEETGNENMQNRVPDKEKIEEALEHVDYRNLLINDSTVILKDPEASVTLGFIAKGFIADKIKEYLLSQNVKSAIINLGGNLLAVGSKPDGTPFQFGIQKPFDKQGAIIATLPVSDRSLVSSGIYERCFYQDDVLYHHILNSSTGYPVQNNLLGVTILSDSSMMGDALSTTCLVLGLDDGMALIESLDGVEAIFITDDYELHYSNGL
ncbi:MAG: FAD:protein FMN transferase [Lachnospiraceae bacterium]|nr:FAD:protein FMN transferase [Lachnospiraceae bacterium]